MLETICLLGVRVSRVDLDSAAAQIVQWVKEGFRTYVCVAPAWTLVQARRDPDYAQVLNEAGMVTPDGMPVVWLARAKGCPEVGRAYGPDLMRLLCKREGLRHYFFGASPEVLEQLAGQLKKDLPGIQIAGMFAPPFNAQAQFEAAETIKAINDARPDILWVGLGSPKQDLWMEMHRDRLDVPVIAGVGAALDFLAGAKPQAPLWMQRAGLEWLFRLCCEPRRLWKRYLVGNSLFLFYVLVDLFRGNSRS